MYRLAYKLDLDKGLHDPALYPLYTWEGGRIDYGGIATDVDFAFVHMNGGMPGGAGLRYGFLKGSRIEFAGWELFAAPKLPSFQFETGSWSVVDQKWRAWDGTAVLSRDEFSLVSTEFIKEKTDRFR